MYSGKKKNRQENKARQRSIQVNAFHAAKFVAQRRLNCRSTVQTCSRITPNCTPLSSNRSHYRLCSLDNSPVNFRIMSLPTGHLDWSAGPCLPYSTECRSRSRSLLTLAKKCNTIRYHTPPEYYSPTVRSSHRFSNMMATTPVNYVL